MTEATANTQDVILDIKNLKVNFYTYEGVVKALDGIDLSIYKGESFGLVGETGCGKSVTVRSVMRLIEEPGKIVEGEIFYKGNDVLKLKEKEIRKLRGAKMTMIFQDPMTFLNPVIQIGEQVSEMFLIHQKIQKDILDNKKKLSKYLKEKVVEIFDLVKLPDAAELFKRYPHELSGGMRQRVLIAMSIAADPDIIIADEATTALDVTIQAQILNLLNKLKKDLGRTLIFVTHNLGIVAEMCDRVAVLYGGQIAEVAETKALFVDPIHPYTQGLLKSIPLLHKPKDILDSIDGVVPNLVNPPSGCRFHPRCPLKEDICAQERPKLVKVLPEHWVHCHVKQREYEGKV
ncbi:MAG: ABC transporter ATP-binding protein [Candidatus Hodarchaeales archaeon]|jgi:oligopeptide/dipeptide ABC transporter ATP-binding protein